MITNHRKTQVGSSSNSTKIIIALIGALSAIIVAIIPNWEKIFPKNQVTIQNTPPVTYAPSVNYMLSHVNFIQKFSSFNPSDYRIRLYDLIMKEVYCDITRFSVDEKQGILLIDFDYRGGTTAIIKNINNDTLNAVGNYSIRIPLIKNIDVPIELRFNADGTASGKWHNMGKSGNFDIIKK